MSFFLLPAIAAHFLKLSSFGLCSATGIHVFLFRVFTLQHIVCFCSWVWKKQHNNHFSSYVQAEARLLVVGVMGKILNSDSRGVSATLLERMKEATTQVRF